MLRPSLSAAALGIAIAAAALAADAAPVTYRIDPDHTFPSFEADHMGGLSVWRGKFNRSSGEVVLDKAKGTGTLDIVVDMDSIDFGHDPMNTHAKGADFFDVAQHPQATFTGKLEGFKQGKPTRATGTLTLRGVTRPVVLKIDSFKCMPHPMLKREVCGADVFATLQRDEFGISAGKDYGFDMRVALRIQVEAIAAE